MNWIKKTLRFGEKIKTIIKERATKTEIANSDWTSCCKGPILKKDLEEMTSDNGYDLDRNKPSSYSSGMFSKLAYEDLKKAHTETVVPVTHDDYLKKEKYSNMEDIKMARSRQNINPLSEQHSKAILNKKNYSSEKVATNLAYDLLKQEEEAKRLNERWWRNLKQLEF